jgi:hypothetical protein
MTESYTPIDNHELIDLVEPLVAGNNIRIVSDYQNDMMLSIRGVFDISNDIPTKVGDITKKGIAINNSEVGYMAVQFRAFLYRLVCTNGMIAPKDMGGFHCRHRGNKQRILDYSTQSVISLNENLSIYLNSFERSRQIELKNPVERIKEDVDEKNWPDKWEDIFTTAYQIEPSETLFGLINAYTRGAQKLTLHNRIMVEEYATSLLRTVH